MTSFTTSASHTIYKDAVLSFRRDTVQGLDGESFERSVVEFKYAVAVVPYIDTGRFVLINHYRHPIKRCLLEIPGGGIEQGETSEAAAIRELQEETGYRTESIWPLGSFFPEPAFCDHHIDLFLARVGEQGLPLHETSEIRNLVHLHLDDVYDRISRGDIASSWSLIGLQRAIGQLRITNE